MKLDDLDIFDRNQPNDRYYRAKNLLPVLDLVRSRTKGLMNIFELGSMRANTQGHKEMDGHSTYWFARWAKDNNALVTTVDLQPNCLPILQQYEREDMQDYQGVVTCVHGEGLKLLDQWIARGWTADFIYLDGVCDSAFTMESFDRALDIVSSTGIIALDDCQVPRPGAQEEKGGLIRPWLEEHGVKLRFTGVKILVVEPKEIF